MCVSCQCRPVARLLPAKTVMVTSGLEPGGIGDFTPPSFGIMNSDRWEVSVSVMV